MMMLKFRRPNSLCNNPNKRFSFFFRNYRFCPIQAGTGTSGISGYAGKVIGHLFHQLHPIFVSRGLETVINETSCLYLGQALVAFHMVYQPVDYYNSCFIIYECFQQFSFGLKPQCVYSKSLTVLRS